MGKKIYLVGDAKINRILTLPPLSPLQVKQIKVITAIVGAETEKIIRCFRALFRSKPSCNRNVTRPKAAGALCNIIAKNTMTSTSRIEIKLCKL